MEKTEITSLDIKFLIKELRQVLIDGVFRKIYQYRSKGVDKPVNQFLFEIFVSGKGNFWLYVDDKKIFLTKHKKAVPQEPPSFCMFLRKHVLNKRIRTIEQHSFDRIVRIITDENVIIFELFSPGNVILCDSTNNIIMPLEIQRWKDRDIKPKIPYRYPPQKFDPFNMDFDDFKRVIKNYEKASVIFLATNLGFGSVYANEICARAEVDPNKPGNKLLVVDIVQLHKAMGAMDKMTLDPHSYEGYVSPMPLKTFSDQDGSKTSTFSEALDNFFSDQAIVIEKEEEVQQVVEQKERVERIMESQTGAKDKWDRIEDESRKNAEAIYSFYSTVQGAIEGIRKARDMNIPWDEIKARISSEGSPEAESIKEIREGDGIIVLDLGGREVEIDIRKSVEENAEKYYEDAKWAKRKMGGAESAMGDTQDKLDQFEQSKPEKVSYEPPKEEMGVGEQMRDAQKTFDEEMKSLGMTNIKLDDDKPEEKEQSEPKAEDSYEFDSNPSEPEKKPEPQEQGNEEPSFSAAGTLDMFAQPESESEPAEEYHAPVTGQWYEKFKWFFSSDGLLVIAGKDAESNEEIIKKYAESNDIVFHADIPGAAFTVIKSQDGEISSDTKKEASEFAAVNSKAWSKGLGTIDVYAVPRAQVTKTPPSGENLPKGAFMINGGREWFRDTELKLSVGVGVDQENNTARVLSGPVMPIRKNTNYFITIKPGFKKSTELARIIKNKILIKAKPEDKFLIEKIPLEEFQKTVPSGMGEVAEYV